MESFLSVSWLFLVTNKFLRVIFLICLSIYCKIKSTHMTEENIKLMEEAMCLDDTNVRRLKSDKGLIERAESCRTILTEDNRQLLND